jgi:hypothetical protein
MIFLDSPKSKNQDVETASISRYFYVCLMPTFDAGIFIVQGGDLAGISNPEQPWAEALAG